ncbi:MAG: hypothetical protein AB8E15_14145 [Bdellovibrionales bacterium]
MKYVIVFSLFVLNSAFACKTKVNFGAMDLNCVSAKYEILVKQFLQPKPEQVYLNQSLASLKPKPAKPKTR